MIDDMKVNVNFILLSLLILSWMITLSLKVKMNKMRDDDTMPRVDTIYKTKVFQPEKEYKTIQVPKLVVFYPKDSVPVHRVEADLKRIDVNFGFNQLKSYSTQFLAKYPESNKLVQILLDHNILTLTELDSSGDISTRKYKVNPNLYRYSYFGGTMTKNPQKFLKKFRLSSEIMIRPLSNLYDVNLGLGRETSFLYYEIGLNSHWYPGWETPFGLDPYIRVRYVF